MIFPIDAETLFRLRGLVGARLVRFIGRRYPNPPSYDSVQLVTQEGTIVSLAVRMEDVADRFEVGSIFAREAGVASDNEQCDDVRLADFRVDHVLALRRAEWLESLDQGVDTAGENPTRQRVGDPSEILPWTTHALVDAGIMLVDNRGSRLLLQADSFPMVMQCHYSIGSTNIPRGEVRDLAESQE